MISNAEMDRRWRLVRAAMEREGLDWLIATTGHVYGYQRWLTNRTGLAATLAAVSPVLTLLMCYVPRLMIPVIVYAVNNLAVRWHRNGALAAAAIAGSLCNTILYLGMMLVFYMMMGIEYGGLLALIGGTGLLAGGCEAVVAAVITTPIVMALRKIQR